MRPVRPTFLFEWLSLRLCLIEIVQQPFHLFSFFFLFFVFCFLFLSGWGGLLEITATKVTTGEGVNPFIPALTHVTYKSCYQQLIQEWKQIFYYKDNGWNNKRSRQRDAIRHFPDIAIADIIIALFNLIYLGKNCSSRLDLMYMLKEELFLIQRAGACYKIPVETHCVLFSRESKNMYPSERHKLSLVFGKVLASERKQKEIKTE